MSESLSEGVKSVFGNWGISLQPLSTLAQGLAENLDSEWLWQHDMAVSFVEEYGASKCLRCLTIVAKGMAAYCHMYGMIQRAHNTDVQTAKPGLCN